MKKYKVALIHNIISPYRVPLFEGLSNHSSIDLSVYFCAKKHGIRKWDILESKKYNYEILSGVTLEFSGIIYHINPAIISKLILNRFDAVIIGGSIDFTTQAAFIISKLLKTPIILWSEGIENSQSTLGKAINPLIQFIIRNVDAVIVPGTLSRDFHLKQGAVLEKIFIAPNIVDNETFKRSCLKFRQKKEKLKSTLNIHNKKNILFVGRLVKGKGIDCLIKAFKKLKGDCNDCGLVIVGNGPFKNELEKICTVEYIEDVYFTGWLSEERMMYYSIADIFVLPTRRDVWGLVINEAMCCGLPVISTNAAGCAVDMIKPGENGFIVDVDDVDQLYSAIKKIILDDELARKMGERSLAIIENKFYIEKMINGFVDAINYSNRV